MIDRNARFVTFAFLGSVLALLAVAVVTGCGGEEEDDDEGAEVASPAAAEARQIFTTRCATCHGEFGRGNGPASAGLDPHPRNFTDQSWQRSVTDEHIERIIQYGGSAVGRSAAMPPNPDLTGKPEVVVALREHIRSLPNN